MLQVISTVSKPATKADIGKPVLVYANGVGNPPVEAVIKTVDELSGYIIEVVIKDPLKEEKVLAVKTKIVTFLYKVPGWIQFLIDLFKK